MIKAWCRFMDEGKQKCGVSLALLVLRVSAGGMILLGHGWGKVQKYSALTEGFPDPLGIGSQFSLILAIGAEVGCSALVILGLGTRLAAIPLIATMGIAALVHHAADPFFLPRPAGPAKELAVLYLIPFVVLLFAGGGTISADHVIRKSRSKES